jgi:hypothetical protein
LHAPTHAARPCYEFGTHAVNESTRLPTARVYDLALWHPSRSSLVQCRHTREAKAYAIVADPHHLPQRLDAGHHLSDTARAVKDARREAL